MVFEHTDNDSASVTRFRVSAMPLTSATGICWYSSRPAIRGTAFRHLVRRAHAAAIGPSGSARAAGQPCITADGSTATALVIATDEEHMIARHTTVLLRGIDAAPPTPRRLHMTDPTVVPSGAKRSRGTFAQRLAAYCGEKVPPRGPSALGRDDG